MAPWYVVALMETRKASNRPGIGHRSFWACHSGPYESREDAVASSLTITSGFGLSWRGTEYYAVDWFAVEKDELSVYGLDRKQAAKQVLLPGLGGM